MGRKRHTAEEIVAKLRQVDVLTAQGRISAENGQSYIDRQKKRPRGWAAFRFDQFADVSIRLQKNLVSRLNG